MLQTRLCKLLGIKYPIVQASMAWVTDAVMVAAISEAGGLGTLGPNAGAKSITRDPAETGRRLREQIKKVRELTSNPFAVNIVSRGRVRRNLVNILSGYALKNGFPLQ